MLESVTKLGYCLGAGKCYIEIKSGIEKCYILAFVAGKLSCKRRQKAPHRSATLCCLLINAKAPHRKIVFYWCWKGAVVFLFSRHHSMSVKHCIACILHSSVARIFCHCVPLRAGLLCMVASHFFGNLPQFKGKWIRS